MYIITITRDDVELASVHIEDKDEAHRQYDKEVGQAPPGAYLTFRDEGRITKQHAAPASEETDEPVSEPVAETVEEPAEPVTETEESVVETDEPKKKPVSSKKSK